MRGVSAVGGGVAWACGSEGTVLKTVDGGETWTKVNSGHYLRPQCTFCRNYEKNMLFGLGK